MAVNYQKGFFHKVHTKDITLLSLFDFALNLLDDVQGGVPPKQPGRFQQLELYQRQLIK
jgi:hypothetical protein